MVLTLLVALEFCQCWKKVYLTYVYQNASYIYFMDTLPRMINITLYQIITIICNTINVAVHF